VLFVAKNDVDFTDTLRKYFGKFGWNAGMIIFIGNFSIPVILYFGLLSQTLYPIIMFVVWLITGVESTGVDTSLDFS
jgi:hypothetical protein